MCRILEAFVLLELVALKLHCIAFVQNLFPIKLKTEWLLHFANVLKLLLEAHQLSFDGFFSIGAPSEQEVRL